MEAVPSVLTESILLATIGAAFGLLLARWADAALLRLVAGGTDRSRSTCIWIPECCFSLGRCRLDRHSFWACHLLRAARLDLTPF